MDKRIVKPNYKIGDIVVYTDMNWDNNNTPKVYYQSKITESYGLIDEEDPRDILYWYYHTEQTKLEDWDHLCEQDILYKLN